MCYEIKPDVLIKNIATHYLPLHNIIWYKTYWVCLPLFVKRVPILAVCLLEVQGHQYKDRSTSYACVKVKNFIKFLNWPVKSLGKHGHWLGPYNDLGG